MIVKFNGSTDKMFNRSSLSIGGMPVGAFLGEISLASSERENMIKVCKRIWRHVMDKCPNSHPRGLYRPDLIPKFNSSKARNGCVGELEIAGVYEINGHSPECLAAASVMRKFLPEIPCVNAAAIVADKVKETFGEEIAFVVGHKSALKHHWYSFLVKDLKEAGLRIKVMSQNDVMNKRPQRIWRWGDACFGRRGQYKRRFNEWLFEQNDSIVFNAILSPKDDVSDKCLLLSSDDPDMKVLLGNNRPLDSNSIWDSVDVVPRKDLVVKPNRGASGRDVYFSRKYYTTDWIELLLRLYGSGEEYSLWEFKALPAIELAGRKFAIDINPAFWVDGDKIEYLYTIIRLDEYRRYKERLKMNVAEGAGIAGIIV